MNKKIVILILMMIVFTFSCSKKPKVKEAKPAIKEQISVRYFKEQIISTNNQYQTIQVSFEKEIVGNPDEVTRSLQAIENNNESYYRVYYYSATKIFKYEYIQKGDITGTAQYNYGDKNSKLKDKVVKVEYYNEDLEQCATDEISYDVMGHPIKTTRYILPGRKLSSLF